MAHQILLTRDEEAELEASKPFKYGEEEVPTKEGPRFPLPPYAVDLRNTLGSVKSYWDFAVGGSLGPLLPGLHIEGVGPISLPLHEEDAEAIARVASQAPFGRGTESVIDTSVRDTLQLHPSALSFHNPQWEETLSSIVQRVKREMGVADEVSASLYKLLLYKPGGFFLVHRDGEKEPGMFATLTLMLTSAYTGGQLEVELGSTKKTFDLAAENAFQTCYTAFFCDCQHEVKPVTSGHRLCLVYSLCVKGTGAKQPHVEQQEAVVAAVVSSLRSWVEAPPAAAPVKLLHMFDHRYTQDGLRGGLLALKGQDRAVGQVIISTLTQHPGLVRAHLGLVERCRKEDLTEWPPVVSYEYYRAKAFTTLAGERLKMSYMSVDMEHEALQGNVFKGQVPDTDEEEQTGNDPVSRTTTYHRAALFLWPVCNDLKVQLSCGSSTVTKYLEAALHHAMASEPKDAAAHAVAWQELVVAAQCTAAELFPVAQSGYDTKRYPRTFEVSSNCDTSLALALFKVVCELPGVKEPSAAAILQGIYSSVSSYTYNYPSFKKKLEAAAVQACAKRYAWAGELAQVLRDSKVLPLMPDECREDNAAFQEWLQANQQSKTDSGSGQGK